MSVNETIENIKAKCVEINTLNSFIRQKAGIAGQAPWNTYDPGYVKMSSILKLASAQLIALAQELEALIPSP